MIKLVVTDLDGTFLNNHHTFNKEYFVKVHDQLKQKGILFVACTGKQCERVEALFEGIGEDIWILGDSATRIKKAGQVIKDFTIEREIAMQSIDQVGGFASGLSIIVCTRHAAYVHSSIDEDAYKIVRGSYEKVIKVDHFNEIEGEVLKITVYDGKGRSSQLRKHVECSLLNQIYIVDSEANWLDITALGVHKGETVKAIQSMLGVTKEETVSFGDGENDVELMDIASYSFAVNNACENTKKAAQYVMKLTNDQDGVLHTIEALLNLNE
ncbi:HAD-IIB family hydrolase [Alkalihalobacillus sp. NPDC078783]